jgi:hypothetical protein
VSISLAGIGVCIGLFALGCWQRGPLVVALLASYAFGATAIGAVGGSGGSSPLIWTVFAVALLFAVLLRRNLSETIFAIFKSDWVPWIVLFLAVYAALGAIILPRVFAGQTPMLVPVEGAVVEQMLAPSMGNITQPLYFIVGILLFYAFLIIANERPKLHAVRRGFFALASFQVALGVIDLGGKLAGLGDILAPIRSASYAMLTDVGVSGFWRITGAYSEASAFAGASIPCLAFVFTYWKVTGSRFALGLSLALGCLLVLSTSSTAYFVLAILALAPSLSLASAFLSDHLDSRDLAVAGAIVFGMVLLGFVYLMSERALDPFMDLVNSMVFEKHTSASGLERAYWNAKSLASFADTAGFGIGMGSSRSSSWLVSVISQLGIVGTCMMAALVVYIVRGVGTSMSRLGQEEFALVQGARAAAISSLLTSIVAGSGADPGLFFFIGLALLIKSRERAYGTLGRPLQPTRLVQFARS